MQEQNPQLDHFVGSVPDASESSDMADRNKPFNLLYYLLDQLL